MSHLSTVELNIKDQDALIEALVDVGIGREHIKIHETAVKMDNSPNKANVYVDRAHSLSHYTDLGFEKLPNGNYAAHIDLYGSGAKLKDDIFKRYTYHTVMNTAKAYGHRKFSEEKFVDAKTKEECIRLVLRR